MVTKLIPADQEFQAPVMKLTSVRFLAQYCHSQVVWSQSQSSFPNFTTEQTAVFMTQARHYTTLQSMMNAKLSKQRF